MMTEEEVREYYEKIREIRDEAIEKKDMHLAHLMVVRGRVVLHILGELASEF